MNRFPPWLRQEIPGRRSAETARALSGCSVHTVCREARCPNLGECFKNRRLSFMILGDVCTRTCAFCGVKKAPCMPLKIDPDEAHKISEAVRGLGLKFAVITSVSRDDLPDGGAKQFFDVITALHRDNYGVMIEVLVPDFKGSIESIARVLDSRPDVFAHNIETVPRLYGSLRPQADYGTSLRVLHAAMRLKSICVTKSSVMLGLGESEKEIVRTMSDLIGSGVDVLTLGQYLSPSEQHYPVKEFISPEQFNRYKEIGLELGFKAVQSGPLVRSSYRAQEVYGEVTSCMI